MIRIGLGLVVLMSTVVAAQSTGVAPNPFGEPNRTSTNHLSVAVSASATEVAPGGKVSVTLDVTPRRGMHVYAPGKHDYQVVSFVVAPQPWLEAAATKYPASEVYHFEPLDEKVEVYQKPFRLSREVTILATPAATRSLATQRAVTIAGTLEYQACDDKVCYAPTKVPVKVEVGLKK